MLIRTKTKIPGTGPTASRWSARDPGKRTRREDHALLIVRDEFRTGYSLIGLLASIARLRFTGIVRITLDGNGRYGISSNGNCVFSPVSHSRGAPHVVGPTAAIGGVTGAMAEAEVIAWKRGPEHLLELTFDEGRQGKRAEFLPALPLIFRW